VSTATTVPVTTSDEAAAHIAELGMQREFALMLEHSLQEVPSLRCIKVTLEHDPEGEDDPRVVIWCNINGRGLDYEPAEDNYGAWKVRTFPPEVCRHFIMLAPIYPNER
jgi:hypothetical protein